MWANQRQSGFTIVELVVVIVVISILATISVAAYGNIQSRAKAARNKTIATEVVQKAEIWNGITGSYPTYGQLKTNSIDPTQPGGVWTAGSTSGPSESRLGSNIVLVEDYYPLTEDEIGYITCVTPGGFYAVYSDPTTASTVNDTPIGSPTPIIYGSSPFCN